MKALLSSKLLAKELAKIDFEKERILEVTGLAKQMIIKTNRQRIKIYAQTMGFDSDQHESTRWDLIRRLLSSVEDQPIVLEVDDNFVNVIFQF